MSISLEKVLRQLSVDKTGRKFTRNRSLSKIEYKKSKKITYKSYSSELIKMNDQRIFYTVTDIEDLIQGDFLEKLHIEHEDVIFKSLHLICSIKDWAEFEDEHTGDRIRTFHTGEDNGIVIYDKLIIRFSGGSNSINIKLIGTRDMVNSFENVIRNKFSIAESFIDWIYSSDGSSVTVPLTEDKTPISEMYPFIKNESLEDYYNRYMHSSASVLVLLGPPGTGKTSFVRGLLQYTKTSAIVTYDPELLEKDYVFARFVEGTSNIMVIEDADNFLGSRKEGNTVMHKFLNVGDGLVTTKNKKLIFSTNLPSVKSIDSALVRPGRCFDVLTFNYLNKLQAEKISTKLGLQLPFDREQYSIADIFHQQEFKHVEKRIGFI